jgi:hypothetical protein
MARIATMPGGVNAVRADSIGLPGYQAAALRSRNCALEAFRNQVRDAHIDASLVVLGQEMSADSFQVGAQYQVRTDRLAQPQDVLAANRIAMAVEQRCSERHLMAVEARYQLDLLASDEFIEGVGERFSRCLEQHGLDPLPEESVRALVLRVATSPDVGTGKPGDCIVRLPSVNAAIGSDG